MRAVDVSQSTSLRLRRTYGSGGSAARAVRSKQGHPGNGTGLRDQTAEEGRRNLRRTFAGPILKYEEWCFSVLQIISKIARQVGRLGVRTFLGT